MEQKKTAGSAAASPQEKCEGRGPGAGWPRRSGKQVKFIKRYTEMKRMIEAIGKALYDMVVWVGCLTTGESREEVKNEE